MRTKLLFLLLFVPLHSLLSFTVLHHAFNPPPEGHSMPFTVFSAAVTAPVLLPLVQFDPDGETLPKWFRVMSFPLNSLIWGLGLLVAVVLMKRWRASTRIDHSDAGAIHRSHADPN